MKSSRTFFKGIAVASLAAGFNLAHADVCSNSGQPVNYTDGSTNINVERFKKGPNGCSEIIKKKATLVSTEDEEESIEEGIQTFRILITGNDALKVLNLMDYYGIGSKFEDYYDNHRVYQTQAKIGSHLKCDLLDEKANEVVCSLELLSNGAFLQYNGAPDARIHETGMHKNHKGTQKIVDIFKKPVYKSETDGRLELHQKLYAEDNSLADLPAVLHLKSHESRALFAFLKKIDEAASANNNNKDVTNVTPLPQDNKTSVKEELTYRTHKGEDGDTIEVAGISCTQTMGGISRDDQQSSTFPSDDFTCDVGFSAFTGAVNPFDLSVYNPSNLNSATSKGIKFTNLSNSGSSKAGRKNRTRNRKGLSDEDRTALNEYYTKKFMNRKLNGTILSTWNAADIRLLSNPAFREEVRNYVMGLEPIYRFTCLEQANFDAVFNQMVGSLADQRDYEIILRNKQAPQNKKKK